MKIVHSLALISAAVVLLAARPAAAQDARTVVIRFRKAGDTVAIRNAQITIDHTIEAGLTDSLGMVRVPDLEDGGHIIEAVAKGYQAYFDKFTSGPNVKMPIELEIAAVVMSAKAKGEATDLKVAGFDQRRAKGAGKFFTPAQMKAAEGRPLANFLKIDAGALIVSGPNGESYLASRTAPRAATPCYAAVVRDGLRIYPFDNASPPDLDKIFTDDIARIELYTTAPAEIKGGGSCGAVVMWGL